VEFYLQQAEKQAHLGVWVQLFSEEARRRAKELDAQQQAGGALQPLHGVVVGIKDVFCLAGQSVQAASAILSGFTSPYTATAVQRLLDAGAIILGMLNCDEFAMGSSNEHSVYGKVLNGLDPTRVPGGSSGGSAVAIQMDMCMLSLGSDTGGSVRQPADFCGIIGLKPSYGRISRHGLIAYASSFDTVGIFAKQIADASLALEIMAGADDFDSTVSTQPWPITSGTDTDFSGPFRFAYLEDTLLHPSLDPVIRAAILERFDQLRAEGHTIEPVSFPLLSYIVPTYYVLTTAEASSNLSRYDGVKFGYRSPGSHTDLTDLYQQSRSAGFGMEVKRRIMLGTFVLSAGYFDAYFTRAQRVRRQLLDQTDLIFKQFDAIIGPTVPATAWKFGEKSADPVAMYLADIFTVHANLVGCPAISLPLFQHPNGMPFGLQVMTNRLKELPLLRISERLMQQ
jgi:aspartyl-tRNA(Asn)/glutamyl-tRNA(Gln) amidotransferase subunit A